METLHTRLVNDPAFRALCFERDARDMPIAISAIWRRYGGDDYCSRATIESAAKWVRAHCGAPDAIDHAIDRAPTQAPELPTTPEPPAPPDPPAPRVQLMNAAIGVHPAIEHVDARDVRIDTLERENAMLREQLRWSQRADPAHNTGGRAVIVFSDVHLGDRSHTSRAYNQSWEKTHIYLDGFGPEEIIVVDNGDHIAGRGIYRNQNMDAVLQDTMDQVHVGAIDIMRRDAALKARFPNARVTWQLTHGNHDMSMGERTSPLMVIEARLLGVDIAYCGDATIVNCAHDGTYHLYAEHGFGYSGISPSAPKWLDTMKDKLLVLSRSYSGDARIRRVTHGHTHFASCSIERIIGYYFDTTGGYQRNERVQLGKNQRPSGFLVNVSPAGHDGILQPQLIQPDTDVQEAENSDPHLFQRNMDEASEMLRAYDNEMTRRGVYNRREPDGR